MPVVRSLGPAELGPLAAPFQASHRGAPDPHDLSSTIGKYFNIELVKKIVLIHEICLSALWFFPVLLLWSFVYDF